MEKRSNLWTQLALILGVVCLTSPAFSFADTAPSPIASIPSSALEIRAPESFVTVRGDDNLDPQPGKSFIVSFLIYFERLPKIGVRQNVISKYSSSVAPYAGWAIGVQRYPTSVRAELYLRDNEGRGGWFTFDTIELRARRWYAVTALVNVGQYVNFFFGEPGQVSALNAKTPNSQIKSFVGGVSISELELASTQSDLIIGSANSGRRGFRGKLASIVIAELDSSEHLRGELNRVVPAGANALIASLPQERVKLLLQSGLRDESSFARTVTRVGKVDWTTLGAGG